MKKMIFAALSVFLLIALSACSDDDGQTANTSKTFVLVHGAFQGPYAWQFVKTELEKKGQKVVVVELPGHGADTANPASLSINSYRDKVVAAINAVQGKVILVGHSMGGIVVTAVAEQIPQRIEKLVFVGAFVPANGESLIDLASKDATSLLGPALIPSQDQLTLDINGENLAPIFLADGTAATKQLLIDNYRAEPAIPFTSKAAITAAGFGSVNKYYIYTSQDKAIGIANQHAMSAAAGISQSYTIESSHCPFLSKPAELTDILIKIVK